MTHDMMMGGGMMWVMGLVWLLVILFLVLGIAALVKYLFFSKIARWIEANSPICGELAVMGQKMGSWSPILFSKVASRFASEGFLAVRHLNSISCSSERHGDRGLGRSCSIHLALSSMSSHS
jgi:hypothetical protein